MVVGVSESSKPGPHTAMVQSKDSKQVKAVFLNTLGQAADIAKAPVSRVYTKDYGKVQEKGDTDGVTPYLGNPLRW